MKENSYLIGHKGRMYGPPVLNRKWIRPCGYHMVIQQGFKIAHVVVGMDLGFADVASSVVDVWAILNETWQCVLDLSERIVVHILRWFQREDWPLPVFALSVKYEHGLSS